jgi:hypothetical protein
MVAVVAITLGTVGVVLLSRSAHNVSHQGPVSGSRLTSPNASPTIYGPTTAQLSAPSRDVVWTLVAETVLSRSTDQGKSWDQRGLPARAQGRLSISFINDHEGWLLAPGQPETQCTGAGAVVWYTTGRGRWGPVSSVQSTQPKDSGIAYAQCKEYLYFYDSTHGFLTAWDDNHRPTIYRTADGGMTWAGSTLQDPPGFKTSPGGFTLRAGMFKRFGSTLYVEAWGIQGGESPARQYMFRSTDGGATWSWLTKIPSRYIAMVTESRWLQLIAPGHSMESTNSGQQWHRYASDFSTDTPVGGPEVVFADSQVGYAEGRGQLQRTIDGGLHWERIASPGMVSSTQSWPNVPVGRTGAGLTYDVKHGYLLMFGGASFGDSESPPPGFVKTNGMYQFLSNETWTWDGNHWTLLHPPTSPSPRVYPAMAYDPHRQQVILFGAGYPGDMWGWDGVTWTELHPAHLPQSASNAVLDRDLGSVAMLGVDGPPGATRLTDFVMWQWTGSDWTKSALAGNPIWRGDFGFAYDPDHHQEVLVGGYVCEGSCGIFNMKPVGETWLLRQGKWSQWSPGSVGPSGYARAAFDEARHQMVVVVGYGTPPDWDVETWTWDGATWTKRDSLHRPPGQLSGQSLAYDAANGRVLMFGGKSDHLNSIPLNQTWAWDGNDWVRLA